MKRNPEGWRKALRSECYFSKPSTRPRVSVEAAVHRLGALPIMLRSDELQLGRGEPIGDTARVLSSYCAAIVVRTFAQSEVEEVAAAARVPVIDGNNVAHSLMEAGARGHGRAHRVPAGLRARRSRGARRAAVAAEHGGRVRVLHDAREAVQGAQAVHKDVWVSMGDEVEQERRLAQLREYQVTPELMALAGPQPIFLHCLPARHGPEVSAEVVLATGDWEG
jgi:ornithine carbamoyltransferase